MRFRVDKRSDSLTELNHDKNPQRKAACPNCNNDVGVQ